MSKLHHYEEEERDIVSGELIRLLTSFKDKEDPVCKDRRGLLILDAEPTVCR